MARRYDVSAETARADFVTLQDAIVGIAEGGEEICPVSYLEVERIEPMSAQLSAPYRMDLALTYRCNNDCAHCYNARERNFPELGTEQWFKVLDQLWALGVPHIVFTGGEATLRDDLPELIHHAESNGQITGLNTNARRLSDEKYVQKLVEAGLDHVQVTVESCNEQVHDEMMRARGAFRQTIAGLKNANAPFTWPKSVPRTAPPTATAAPTPTSSAMGGFPSLVRRGDSFISIKPDRSSGTRVSLEPCSNGTTSRVRRTW